MGVAGTMALQALRDHAQLRAGQRIAITGATGGVRSFTVQIAKAYGAHVTAVCRAENVELARQLGADRVVDYATTSFAREGVAVLRPPFHRKPTRTPRRGS